MRLVFMFTNYFADMVGFSREIQSLSLCKSRQNLYPIYKYWLNIDFF